MHLGSILCGERHVRKFPLEFLLKSKVDLNKKNDNIKHKEKKMKNLGRGRELICVGCDISLSFTTG